MPATPPPPPIQNQPTAPHVIDDFQSARSAQVRDSRARSRQMVNILVIVGVLTGAVVVVSCAGALWLVQSNGALPAGFDRDKQAVKQSIEDYYLNDPLFGHRRESVKIEINGWREGGRTSKGERILHVQWKVYMLGMWMDKENTFCVKHGRVTDHDMLSR